MKVLIVGGGASGLMAALTASENPANEVLLLERQTRVARKLLATGNGRCNLSNRRLTIQNYHGECPAFCRTALEEFGVEKTLDYFQSLGLLTVTENSGRVYPYSDSANSVADVLRLTLEQRENVRILTGCEVRSLCRRKGKFVATFGEDTETVDRAIVCAGGAAGGKLGGTELGYRLLSSFGHKCTRLYPSLVQLRTETDYVRALKGVRCEARVRLGAEVRTGEVQFTDYGVSGPVIFELSRNAATRGGGELEIDFLPQVQEETLKRMLTERCRQFPALKAENLLTGILHNRLGRTLLRACGISPEMPCGELRPVESVCHAVKQFRLTVIGTMGMDSAQVTAGGIRTEGFNPETLESRLCPGLYAAGEVLDIDGDCGGYNLQWAWSSGRLAGEMRGTL